MDMHESFNCLIYYYYYLKDRFGEASELIVMLLLRYLKTSFPKFELSLFSDYVLDFVFEHYISTTKKKMHD